MNGDNGSKRDGTESVCEPTIVRCEVALHLAPGFEYLNDVPLGEAESCALEQLAKVELEFKELNPPHAGNPSTN